VSKSGAGLSTGADRRAQNPRRRRCSHGKTPYTFIATLLLLAKSTSFAAVSPERRPAPPDSFEPVFLQLRFPQGKNERMVLPPLFGREVHRAILGHPRSCDDDPFPEPYGHVIIGSRRFNWYESYLFEPSGRRLWNCRAMKLLATAGTGRWHSVDPQEIIRDTELFLRLEAGTDIVLLRLPAPPVVPVPARPLLVGPKLFIAP